MVETDEEYRKRRYKELIAEKTWKAYDKEGRQSLEARGAKGIGSSEAFQIIEKELEQRRHEPTSEGDKTSPSYYPSRYEPRKSSFVGELGNLMGETLKEVSGYPARKVREAVQDIRVGRVVREEHREGRIKNKLASAEIRGAESEEQAYNDKRELKKERQKIALAEEKIARTERAKILTKQKYASRQTRSKVTRNQIIGFGQYGTSYGFYTLPKISFGEYAGWITGGTRVSRSDQQPAQKSSQQPNKSQSSIFELYHGDATRSYALLGFRVGEGKKKMGKKGKKERRFNIFSGTWEEV